MERARRANALAVKKDKDVHTLHPTPYTPHTLHPLPSTLHSVPPISSRFCTWEHRSTSPFCTREHRSRPILYQEIPISSCLCTREHRSRPVFVRWNTGARPICTRRQIDHREGYGRAPPIASRVCTKKHRSLPIFVPGNTGARPIFTRAGINHGCTWRRMRTCVPDLFSQNVSIKWFQKVNSPTKSSTYCFLLIIETIG